MHIAESQDSPQGIFVVDPQRELCAYLAYLVCRHGSPFDSVYYPDENDLPLEDALASDAASIEELATITTDLEPCILRLTANQRTVLYNVLAGWRVSEIAPRIGLSVSWTYRILQDAVAILRQNYGNGHP